MPVQPELDLALLRTFVAIAEETSFTRAAQRVRRTQSAVSLQMQRLESLVGRPLLERGKGGQVSLNRDGQHLLGSARELLAMNDEILDGLQARPLPRAIRLGVADEFSARFLSRILQCFMNAAPETEVEVVSGLSCKLAYMLKTGELDVAVLERGLEPRQWPAEEIWIQPLRWVTSSVHRQHLEEPLPITISTALCEWRPPWLTQCLWSGMAVRALETSGKSFRIVSRSITTAGQLAMVMAGKAVAVSLANLDMPPDLRLVQPDEGLPELPEVAFLIVKGQSPHSGQADSLIDMIRDIVSQNPPTDARSFADRSP